MRFLVFLSLIQLFVPPAFSIERTDFKFQRKNYFFSLKMTGKSSTIVWKKSGFEVKKTSKIKNCFKKNFNSEVLKIRSRLSSASDKKLLGTDIHFAWNGREVKKSLLPKEMDRLDKKFTHLFNILKNGEGKCTK